MNLDKVDRLRAKPMRLKRPTLAGCLNNLKQAFQEGDEASVQHAVDYGKELYGRQFTTQAREVLKSLAA